MSWTCLSHLRFENDVLYILKNYLRDIPSHLTIKIRKNIITSIISNITRDHLKYNAKFIHENTSQWDGRTMLCSFYNTTMESRFKTLQISYIPHTNERNIYLIVCHKFPSILIKWIQPFFTVFRWFRTHF